MSVRTNQRRTTGTAKEKEPEKHNHLLKTVQAGLISYDGDYVQIHRQLRDNITDCLQQQQQTIWNCMCYVNTTNKYAVQAA